MALISRVFVALFAILLVASSAKNVPVTTNVIRCKLAKDCNQVSQRPFCVKRKVNNSMSFICAQCRTSKDCPARTPVCSASGTCKACQVPESAKCSMTTSRMAFGICNRVMRGLSSTAGKGNCVREFARKLQEKGNENYFRKCECQCVNRDVEGKVVQGMNQEACHLRLVVARIGNLSGYPQCPRDVKVGCDAGGICAPVFDGGVSYRNVEIKACGPNGKGYPKIPNTGDDDDDDDDVDMFMRGTVLM